MKISLIFPPASFLMNEKVNPPLGLGYLSSYLKSKGYKDITIYHIIDCNNIPKIEANIIGIGFTTPQFNPAINILKQLKITNPNSLFVAGGVHATSNPEECLKEGFDIVVVGEGEKAILHIVKEYENKNIIEKIVYGNEIKNLDEIPFPDYDAIGIKDYNFMFKDKNFASMFTSRGCPMRCRYCASPVMWKHVRLNSIEYVKKHIDYLHDNYGVDAIMFQDDVFPVNKQRMKIISEYLYDKNMSFRCLARANNLDKESVKILKDNGCIEVGVGIESGNQEMLNIMDKRTTIEQNRQAIINCKEYDLSIKVFILLGSPGESKQTIEDTIRLLEETQPNDIDANVLVLYPSTEFYENIDKYDIKLETNNYDSLYLKGKNKDYKPTISTSKITTDELEYYRKLLFNKFSKLNKK